MIYFQRYMVAVFGASNQLDGYTARTVAPTSNYNGFFTCCILCTENFRFESNPFGDPV